jgi:hypothetical protein
MKIAMHFRAFLEAHNYLGIPGIGRFEVITAVVEAEANRTYTRRLLHFYPDSTPVSDDQRLVDYLCEKLRVEPVVVHSDLEYFTNSTRELLIQGLEAEVPGVGYLNLNYRNQLEFSNKSRYYTAKFKLKKLKPAALGSFWF